MALANYSYICRTIASYSVTVLGIYGSPFLSNTFQISINCLPYPEGTLCMGLYILLLYNNISFIYTCYKKCSMYSLLVSILFGVTVDIFQ